MTQAAHSRRVVWGKVLKSRNKAKMQKYQNVKVHLLTDETLAKRIEEMQEFHDEAREYNDEIGTQMTQDRLDKMRDHLKSRKQSA